MNCMIRLCVTCILLVAGASVHAMEPARVFGLEIGNATEQQARERLLKSGVKPQVMVSSLTGGPLLHFSGSLGMEGLKHTRLIFDQEGVLIGALLTLSEHVGIGDFDRLIKVLDGKYSRISVRDPYVGDQSASYRSGEVLIRVNAPHMSFDTELLYVMKTWKLKADANSRKKVQATRATQEDNL